MVHPAPNGLVGPRHSAFRQQVLDVTQAEGEPEVEPYRLVNDLRREPVSSVADLLHPAGYRVTTRTASPSQRDNAFAPARPRFCAHWSSHLPPLRRTVSASAFRRTGLCQSGRHLSLDPDLLQLRQGPTCSGATAWVSGNFANYAGE